MYLRQFSLTELNQLVRAVCVITDKRISTKPGYRHHCLTVSLQIGSRETYAGVKDTEPDMRY